MAGLAEGFCHLGQPLDGFPVGGDDGGCDAVSLHDELVAMWNSAVPLCQSPRLCRLGLSGRPFGLLTRGGTGQALSA